MKKLWSKLFFLVKKFLNKIFSYWTTIYVVIFSPHNKQSKSSTFFLLWFFSVPICPLTIVIRLFFRLPFLCFLSLSLLKNQRSQNRSRLPNTLVPHNNTHRILLIIILRKSFFKKLIILKLLIYFVKIILNIVV